MTRTPTTFDHIKVGDRFYYTGAIIVYTAEEITKQGSFVSIKTSEFKHPLRHKGTRNCVVIT